MSLPQTVLTAMGVGRSSRPASDADAIARVARSQESEWPRAACFPRDDLAFAERVQVLFDGGHAEQPFVAAVQALLRETYPLAVISPRHELAALDRGSVWYVFRDGSALPSVDRETP